MPKGSTFPAQPTAEQGVADRVAGAELTVLTTQSIPLCFTVR